MKFKLLCNSPHFIRGVPVKTLMIMKLTVILLIASCFSAFATTANAQRVSLTMQKASLQQLFRELNRQTGYQFFYKDVLLNKAGKVDVEVNNASVEEVLDECLRDKSLEYKIIDRTIVIKPREEKAAETSPVVEQQKDIIVRGRVFDSQGEALIGVSVFVKGSSRGFVTNHLGEYELRLSPNDKVLVFSSVGMVKQEVMINNRTSINVVMKENATEIGDVVVTGIVNRRAESFTGSSVTIKKDQLISAGNQNILQSLKNIDPAFKIVENVELGSNPNSMPEIVLRGKSSMPDIKGTYSGNPNQPLFILDGFETTIQKVYDLDINRVKSITILKDAAAKAVYGSKAGNGVVVIETEQPKQGRLRVSYTGDLNIEAPDLTGYNLMNAKEKLQWEKEHDMWKTYYSGNDHIARQEMYNQLYQDVYMKGVNTYWLSKPLQTGIGQKHSLYFDGGDEFMRYGANFSYNNITGAMKGSDRNTFNGSTNLSYRYKNMKFTNQIEFTQNTANNSPYGSFSDYVKMNPYWTPYDDNGNAKKIAGYYPAGANSASWNITYNPLYNASLNIIDRSKYLQVMDNFYMEWNILNNLKFTGSIGYTYQKNGSDKFLPPSHTDFLNYTETNGLINYKGNWTQSNGVSQSLESNVGLNYTYSKGKHLAFGNLTFNVSDAKNNSNIFVAEGFGSDNVSDISMATYYQRASSPLGSDDHSRSIGVVGIFSYTYDNRYLFDATYRTSGSSIYGSNARWGSFWSVGAGWNLQNEEFIKELGLFQQLKLRGSLGYTGSQNASAFMTRAMYTYSGIVYDGIKGAILEGLPNPNLGWQKNMDYNVGLDMSAFKNKFSARVDVYRKTTTNLLQDITSPPSFGFETYKDNLGKTQNSGYEISLRYQIFNNTKRKAYLNISANALHNKNVLKDISDAFKSYNDEQDENTSNTNQLYTKPVARYYEGQSLTAIWAMKSLGIDPNSGQELFMKKDGTLTYNWSSSELVIAGDNEPDLSGTFGFNGGYMGFNLSLTCSYKLGGQIYNSTLAERVENIDGKSNLDRRINNAWKNVGDIAIYKAPQVSASTNRITYTKPTTRFVQDNNELYFSSINLSYDVQSRRFLERLGMERLKISFYTNELLRLSSIKTERGISYPFARNFSFSLQATF